MSEQADDIALLIRWREGDPRAGERLVRRYYPLIRRFFIHKVAHADDAIELTQETFAACARRKEHIHGIAGVDPQLAIRRYLFGIASNLLRDYIAKRTKRQRERVDFREFFVNSIPSPPSILHQRQEERLLVDALRALPLEQQLALELNLFEGLSGREIAELLEIPEGTVRGRLRLAKASLHRQITALAASPQDAQSTITNLVVWAQAIRQRLAGDLGPA